MEWICDSSDSMHLGQQQHCGLSQFERDRVITECNRHDRGQQCVAAGGPTLRVSPTYAGKRPCDPALVLRREFPSAGRCSNASAEGVFVFPKQLKDSFEWIKVGKCVPDVDELAETGANTGVADVHWQRIKEQTRRAGDPARVQGGAQVLSGEHAAFNVLE
ncbi:MAG: hypothetical protein AAFX94_09535 [Myxococcota bacterium]